MSGDFPSQFTLEVVAWFDSEREARDAEKLRIKALMPPYNIKHRLREDEMRKMNARYERMKLARRDERAYWKWIDETYGGNAKKT
ncbi:MAG: hypothetical protein ABL931_13725 [Usitatibacteraceae bacterium]